MWFLAFVVGGIDKFAIGMWLSIWQPRIWCQTWDQQLPWLLIHSRLTTCYETRSLAVPSHLHLLDRQVGPLAVQQGMLQLIRFLDFICWWICLTHDSLAWLFVLWLQQEFQRCPVVSGANRLPLLERGHATIILLLDVADSQIPELTTYVDGVPVERAQSWRHVHTVLAFKVISPRWRPLMISSLLLATSVLRIRQLTIEAAVGWPMMEAKHIIIFCFWLLNYNK